MKLRAYLRLLRLRTLWLRISSDVFFCMLLLQLGPFTTHRRDAGAFLWLLLIPPLAIGFELSRTLQHHLRPFRAFLPGVPRNLLKNHLPVLAVLGLLFGSLGAWADPGMPWILAVCIVALGLTLMLPLDCGWRWAGSRLATTAVFGFAIMAMLFASTTRGLATQHPWLTAAGCLVFAAGCCRLGFPREQHDVGSVRRRSEVGEAFDPAALEDRKRDQLRRSRRIGQHWTLPSVRSQLDWIRVILHEAYGFRYGWLGQVLLIPMICGPSFLAGLFASHYLTRKPHSSSFSELLYASLCKPDTLIRNGDSTSMLLLIPFAIIVCSIALPLPHRPYPLSRRNRAQLTFAVSLLQAGVSTLLVLASFSALAWFAASIAGAPIRAAGTPAFVAVILAPLPLLPWIYWARLYTLVRPNDRSMQALLLLGGMLLGIIVTTILPRWNNWHLSPATLASIGIFSALSMLIYRRALFKFYRHGDLLQQGNDRHNLSLV